MDGDLSSFEQTVLFIVVVLIAGWYVFTNDDDSHGGWGNH